MPLLYGEGDRAFQRLQEEIIKGSSDETIFAWRQGLGHISLHENFSARGVLASSPRDFAESESFETAMTRKGRPENTTPYMITNRGLQMELQLLPYQVPPGVYAKHIEFILRKTSSRLFVGVLQCTSGALLGNREDRLGLLLRLSDNSPLHYRWHDHRHGVASLLHVDANELHNAPKKQIFLAIS